MERVINFRRHDEWKPVPPEPPKPGTTQALQAALNQLPYGSHLSQLLKGYESVAGAGYPDLEAYRAAWLQHRETLMNGLQGHRPAAWWICDCPYYDQLEIDQEQPGPAVFGRKIPSKADQRVYLELHGELSADELQALAMEPLAEVA